MPAVRPVATCCRYFRDTKTGSSFQLLMYFYSTASQHYHLCCPHTSATYSYNLFNPRSCKFQPLTVEVCFVLTEHLLHRCLDFTVLQSCKINRHFCVDIAKQLSGSVFYFLFGFLCWKTSREISVFERSAIRPVLCACLQETAMLFDTVCEETGRQFCQIFPTINNSWSQQAVCSALTYASYSTPFSRL
jgi:hypothetical protein